MALVSGRAADHDELFTACQHVRWLRQIRMGESVRKRALRRTSVQLDRPQYYVDQDIYCSSCLWCHVALRDAIIWFCRIIGITFSVFPWMRWNAVLHIWVFTRRYLSKICFAPGAVHSRNSELNIVGNTSFIGNKAGWCYGFVQDGGGG